jgi:hypothetical protein
MKEASAIKPVNFMVNACVRRIKREGTNEDRWDFAVSKLVGGARYYIHTWNCKPAEFGRYLVDKDLISNIRYLPSLPVECKIETNPAEISCEGFLFCCHPLASRHWYFRAKCLEWV